MKVFENAETLTNGNLRRIAITAEIWEQEPELKCDTTYGIIFARLFNLSYVDFLKYAVKNYNATIVDSKYPYIVFTNSKDCDALVKELNKRWELIEKYRRNNNVGVSH